MMLERRKEIWRVPALAVTQGFHRRQVDLGLCYDIIGVHVLGMSIEPRFHGCRHLNGLLLRRLGRCARLLLSCGAR
jgi:hypothetical protein